MYYMYVCMYVRIYACMYKAVPCQYQTKKGETSSAAHTDGRSRRRLPPAPRAQTVAFESTAPAGSPAVILSIYY